MSLHHCNAHAQHSWYCSMHEAVQSITSPHTAAQPVGAPLSWHNPQALLLQQFAAGFYLSWGGAVDQLGKCHPSLMQAACQTAPWAFGLHASAPSSDLP